MLILETAYNQTEFSPSDTVRIHAGWHLDNPPREACLRLFWFTKGKVKEDVEIVAEKEFFVLQASFEETMNIKLPAAPYTFNGTLISLAWAIELVLNGGKDVKRLDLVISPGAKRITLCPVKDSSENMMYHFLKSNKNH